MSLRQRLQNLKQGEARRVIPIDSIGDGRRGLSLTILERKGDEMNMLNSVIFEGTLIDDPADDGDGITIFFAESTNTATGNVNMEITALGKLGATCLEVLKAGRGIRVVGCLASYQNAIIIKAEHVEFKPLTKNAMAL